MAADEKEKAAKVEHGIEGALGQATDADQTHSAGDRTSGPPDPPEQRDPDAPDGGTDAQRDAATYSGD